jgi:hypothetical protein
MSDRDEAVSFDLIREAPRAVWSSDTGRLRFGGNRDNPGGFAIHPRPFLLLEDDTRHAELLETHPRWTDNGWIRGEFWVPQVVPGHRLLAEIGFIQPIGEPRTSGVRLAVRFDGTTLHEMTKLYTGRLAAIEVDLAAYAGKAGLLTLEVTANGSSTQAWLVWVNPRIGASGSAGKNR